MDNSNQLLKSSSLNIRIESGLKISQNHIQTKLKLSYFDIILFFIFCFCLRKKSKIYQKYDIYKKTNNIVNNYKEISYILKSINELNKLKFILLSKEQLAMFRIIVNNKISKNALNKLNEENTLMKLAKDFDDYDKMEKLCKKYKVKIESDKKHSSFTDIKLLNIFQEMI